VIDYEELKKALKEMKPRQKLFELIKAEMELRGHWKPKARSKGFKKGFDERRDT
jgi:hypothetical protein